jgi:hypothetical protein
MQNDKFVSNRFLLVVVLITGEVRILNEGSQDLATRL